MTNKEVINFLNQVRKILLDDKSWLESTIQPINEAFDMAISALTAQSETHDKRTEMHACDCVSRRAAIDAMCELMHHWFGGDPKDEIREIKRELEKLPSVQPERPKGHWIFVHPLQENDSGAYMCSECRTGDWDIVPVKDKYCKFCRADMRGEKNG